MKSCLEIENNIKNFIEEYNRNYNKNRNKIDTKSEYNFNKEKILSSAGVKLNPFYSYLFDNTFTIDQSFPRKSLSLNSINSDLNWNKFDHHNDHSNKNNNIIRKRQRSKSESDLFDIINNKSCLYYFDETSIDNNEDYEEEDDDDDVLSICNQDKYKNDYLKTRFQTCSSTLSNKNDNKNHKENKSNFSLKRLFHNSLSTVEEFLSSLNESTTSINVNHHYTSDISSSNTSTRSTQPPFTSSNKIIHVSTISSLVNYYVLDDYVDINIQKNKSLLTSPSTSTSISLSIPILSLSTNNLLINHQNKKGMF
jgi:hypothetical protein